MKVVVTRTLAGGVELLKNSPLIDDLHVEHPGIGPTRQRLLELIRGAHGVLGQFLEKVDEEYFEAAGPQLKIVANYSVGFNNVDLEEATERGVWITHTPDAVTEPTADMVWTLLLATARRVYEGDQDVRTGAFAKRAGYDPCYLLGGVVEGATLLIVGAGRIGYATAMRSIGWNMRVLYVARSPHPDFEQAVFKAQRVTLDEGLKQADYVSLHTPLTPQTHHLIGRRELGQMKPTAYLINTARGPVVDEGALVEALRANRIAGAGLDVFENEPKQHPGLVNLPNVCLMPHVGSASVTARPEMSIMAQRNILAVLSGDRPPNPVNDLKRR